MTARPATKLTGSSAAGAARAARHLDALTRAYARTLRAAGRRAATHLERTQTITAAANPEWVPPPTGAILDQQELATDTQRKTGKLHRLMLADAAQTALEPFGITFDIAAPTSQAILDSVAARIQGTISAAIEEQITAAVQAGYRDGHSVTKVASAIRTATSEISRPRSEMLARTDLNALANAGSVLAATLSGASDTKTWLTAEDDRVRETHADADGQTVPIDQPFDVGGEQAQYPGDPSLSWEESANCRCTVIYGQPLTASAAAATISTGGTMDKDDVQKLTLSERAALQALLAEPLTPEAARLAAVRATLAERGADGVLGDDEITAVMAVVEALAAAGKHRYAGDGGSCAICGEPADSETAHYAAITAALTDIELTAAGEDGNTRWTATLCVTGVPAVDSGIKRMLDAGGGSFLPLPLPLALMDDSPHADVVTKAPVCGRIDQIWQAGNRYQASGIFCDGADDPELAQIGAKAAELVGDQLITGISVDLVDCEAEMMVYSGDTVTALDDWVDSEMDDVNDPSAPGEPIPASDLDIAEGTETDGDGDDLQFLMVFTRWAIAGATICPVQALTDATIAVVADASGTATFTTRTEWKLAALTAAAAGLAPLDPPRDWFEMPEPAEATPLTVTDDGQVYGHLALWGTCHAGKPGACVTAPPSPSRYRHFHRGQVKTAEGDRVDVGVLTMNTGHAGLRLNASATVAHYDDTGTQAAHVRATDGTHGIWLAGALNPKLPAEDARLLMASSPSGDWRELTRGDGLDLFGVLAVNVPGFPVPRPAARLVASGEEMERVALVAAGRLDAAGLEDGELERQLAVLAASADGLEALAALASG